MLRLQNDYLVWSDRIEQPISLYSAHQFANVVFNTVHLQYRQGLDI